VRQRRKLSFSLGVHAAVFQAEIFAISAHADCMEGNYTYKEASLYFLR
jgi:hypothetical protein